MTEKHSISIWFFIGTLLLVYGVAIAIANIYEVFVPSAGPDVVLKELHFGVWWGFLLIALGLTYFIKFFPHRSSEKQTH